MIVAYYCVVQYVPDPERDERKNVGVVVATTGDARVTLIDREDLDRPEVVHRFGELLEYVLGIELSDAPSAHMALDDLAQRRFSRFKLSEPRTFETEADDPTQIAQRLIERLVNPTGASLGTV